MPRPRFVLAGVPKAGTTSLYRYLHAQPGVYVSDVKEINFLSYPGATLAKERYPWLHFPVTTVDAYDALFADAGNRVPIDVSPSCFRSEVSIARMQEFLHEPGILLLLRDPVERAWSAYQDQVRKGYEHRPPERALVPGERMVELGFYAERVGAFQRAFGAGLQQYGLKARVDERARHEAVAAADVEDEARRPVRLNGGDDATVSMAEPE